MTEPQDPFAAPSGQPPVPPAPPPPAYGAPPPPPPPGYGTPPPPAYGQPPAYGYAPMGGITYASWGLRVVATLIDAVILIVIDVIVSIATGSSSVTQVANLLVEVGFAYMVGTRGQSPGKQVMKIKIVRDSDGQVIGFGIAILRAIAHIADTFSLLIGWLWPLWDKKRQTFADKIVGSVPIRV